MIRKFTSLVALVFMAHLSMSAAYSIIVHTTDGKDEAFVLEKKPVVTFDETDMLVTTEGNVVAIPRTDIRNIDFGDYDGISLPETVSDIVEFIDADNFRVKGGNISVYDIAGANADATLIADGEYTTVSLASCPAGVYIIPYNNKSFKIIKK